MTTINIETITTVNTIIDNTIITHNDNHDLIIDITLDNHNDNQEQEQEQITL